MMDVKQDLLTELEAINNRLDLVEEELHSLLEEQRELNDRKEIVTVQLQSIEDTPTTKTTPNSIDWETGKYEWTERVHSTLCKKFKLRSFRPLQLSCINATMSGKDVILIMPTGGGKSLCYQLPAVVSEGWTLVVSPLVSLMEDQLMSVDRLGIGSSMLNASSSKDHVGDTHAAMVDRSDTSLKLVYVTPEKIAKSKRFMSKVEKAYQLGRLSRIVIDEVHCASQWGHDFRPDYKILGILKRQFPKAPLMGLTATATAKVVEDCKELLEMSRCVLFKASYNRPNLFYEVRAKPPSHKELVDDIAGLIKKSFRQKSGIIYCFSQKDTETLCNDLCGRGISAGCYHANMATSDRSKVHKLWLSNTIQVIVATVAFGMGIDKPDVRFVLHHSPSKSMENYYQESGRAGRDGLHSVCVLYYRYVDIFRQSTMVFSEHTGLPNLYSILRYCINETKCRRALIARHFGETWKDSDCRGLCDVCQNLTGAPGSIARFTSTSSTSTSSNVSQEDLIMIARGFLEAIDKNLSVEKKLTAIKLVDAWRATSSAKSPSFSKSKPDAEKLEKALMHCLLENVVKEDFHFTSYTTICYITTGRRAALVRSNKAKIIMDVMKKKVRPTYPDMSVAPTASDTKTDHAPNIVSDHAPQVVSDHTPRVSPLLVPSPTPEAADDDHDQSHDDSFMASSDSNTVTIDPTCTSSLPPSSPLSPSPLSARHRPSTSRETASTSMLSHSVTDSPFATSSMANHYDDDLASPVHSGVKKRKLPPSIIDDDDDDFVSMQPTKKSKGKLSLSGKGRKLAKGSNRKPCLQMVREPVTDYNHVIEIDSD